MHALKGFTLTCAAAAALLGAADAGAQGARGPVTAQVETVRAARADIE